MGIYLGNDKISNANIFGIDANLTTLNVTPSTSSQSITPTGNVDGWNRVNVNAVTSSIDANIQAENIKDGVSILGVTGNYSGGGGNDAMLPFTIYNHDGYTTNVRIHSMNYDPFISQLCIAYIDNNYTTVVEDCYGEGSSYDIISGSMFLLFGYNNFYSMELESQYTYSQILLDGYYYNRLGSYSPFDFIEEHMSPPYYISMVLLEPSQLIENGSYSDISIDMPL